MQEEKNATETEMKIAPPSETPPQLTEASCCEMINDGIADGIAQLAGPDSILQVEANDTPNDTKAADNTKKNDETVDDSSKKVAVTKSDSCCSSKKSPTKDTSNSKKIASPTNDTPKKVETTKETSQPLFVDIGVGVPALLVGYL